MNKSPEASKIMQEINEAWAIISDPVKRKEYDHPRGFNVTAAKFKKGTKVMVSPNSGTSYGGRAGIVDEEPVRDTFRFWYVVKFDLRGFASTARLPEEVLVEAVR
jgi:curved DNA-binding protein CbpA